MTGNSVNANSNWTFVPDELDEVLSSKGHNALLGHRYHAHGDGWIELAMPWQEALVADSAIGALASGPVMALVDNAAGVAIWLRRGGYLPQVTIDLRVDHLRPSRPGATLVCRCTCTSLTATTALSTGYAHDGSPDDPVCQVTATYMLL